MINQKFGKKSNFALKKQIIETKPDCVHKLISSGEFDLIEEM